MEMLDVLIIGAGQAGLAAGFRAQSARLRFQIVDAAQAAGGSWPYYYDSLTLFSPALYSALPGLAMPGDPDRYPHRDEVVSYLRHYAAHFELPVLQNFRVRHIEISERPRLFRVAADDGRLIESRALVVASGGFGTPRMPKIAGQTDFVGQCLHSRDYHRPDPFEGRRVIVVGAGNSAVQIAVELAGIARVSLATRGRIRWVPQRLLGKDIHFWLKWTGLDNISVPGDPTAPVLDDGRYRRAIRAGRPDHRPMFTRFSQTGVVWPDGTDEPVDVVIFATGFAPTLDFLHSTTALDAQGRPIQKRGVSLSCPGLFYVGLPWQKDLSSATIRGAARDSATIQNALDRWLSLESSS